jgi:hypothetical protein
MPKNFTGDITGDTTMMKGLSSGKPLNVLIPSQKN